MYIKLEPHPLGILIVFAAAFLFGIKIGLFVGLCVALYDVFVAIISGDSDDYLNIYTKDEIKWSWREFVSDSIYLIWWSLLIGSGFGIIVGLLTVLTFTLGLGDGYLFFFGMLSALLLFKLTIKYSEKLTWERLKEDWIEEILVPLLFSLFVGFITFFPFQLYLGLFDNKLVDLFDNKLVDLFFSVLLVEVMFWGMVIGVGGIFMNAIDFNYVDIVQSKHPYFRFKKSAKNLHFIILQHLFLRLKLSKERKIPYYLDKFLNEMASYNVESRQFTNSSVHLLEEERGSWRFRHRLIQDWFTALQVEGEKLDSKTNDPGY